MDVHVHAHSRTLMCTLTCTCVILQWLEDDFLGYLREWEESVAQRPGTTSKEKKNMLLSQETRFGIEVTGKRENKHVHFNEHTHSIFMHALIHNISSLQFDHSLS